MARRADPEARQKLLHAARAAFAEAGVDRARIEDISAAAGLSKGAFYLHFESKEDAWAELVGGFFAVMRDLTEARKEAEDALLRRVGPLSAEDWQRRTPRFMAFYEHDLHHTIRALQAMWRNRDVLGAMLDDAGGPRRGVVEQFIRIAREMVAADLKNAMDAGHLRQDLDSELVSEMILGIYLQLGRRMVRSPTRPDFDTWARTVAALVAEGLAPPFSEKADISVAADLPVNKEHP